MKILLLSATITEIEPTVNWLRARAESEAGNVLHFGNVSVEVLFTGVGMMATAYALGQRLALADLPGLAIQAGVGGAIDRSLELGQVVNVRSERCGDLGAEAPDGQHLSLGEIGLHPGLPFNRHEVLEVPAGLAALPFAEVAGVTVNRVSGSTVGITRLRARYPEAQVESMEGAAFFYACGRAGVEPLQLRAISNYVEIRNRENWQMREAIGALNAALRELLGAFVGGS